MTRVGVDTGGTFTDAVFADGTIAKVPSTPDDPSRAVATVAGGRGVSVLAHGTTVATNALLERKGVRVALVTNAGLEDVVEIARQDRPSLYDSFVDRPVPLVARGDRLGIAGRLDAHGVEIEALAGSLAVPEGVAAVAVCLLHADLNPVHEQAVALALRAGGYDVTCSHEVSPELREYERTVTTVANAYVRPLCAAYLRRLANVVPQTLVMSSAGGLLALDIAAEQPVRLLLSGPAAGVRAAAAIASENGYPNAVSFDMGGTSTDVCLILGGIPEPAPSLSVGGFPIRVPSLDIHTIGAGGGSIARLDAGGALTVGPESAGARPGPACYGLGGTAATVTDADRVLGRIPPGAVFPGLGELNGGAARAALARARLDAADVVTVVDANMAQAVRKVTVERGVDPAPLALVAFGGAGPLHACALAEALDMTVVIVPARAGVFSAVGLLCAPEQYDTVESWPSPLSHDGLPAPADDVSLDCRYVGQSHELTVASVDAFHDEHERRNGYARRDRAVEVIAVRRRTTVAAPLSFADLAPVTRGPVVGPMTLSEPDCTIWVPEGWAGRVGVGGALILERAQP
ncbi:MAG: hydantoinase/oxoprolinase family protein [Acidimicrobiia bacterium]